MGTFRTGSHHLQMMVSCAKCTHFSTFFGASPPEQWSNGNAEETVEWTRRQKCREQDTDVVLQWGLDQKRIENELYSILGGQNNSVFAPEVTSSKDDGVNKNIDKKINDTV